MEAHGAIDQHYEKEQKAATARLMDELERMAQERAGMHATLHVNAKSEEQKSEERFDLELDYEADFLKRSIMELQTRRASRKALSDQRTAKRVRGSE